MFDKLREAVKSELVSSAHSIEHTERVHNLCMHLASVDCDKDVLLAAAILHDIARVREDNDSSGKTDHAILGARMAEPILRKAGFPENKIPAVLHCIRTHRYKSSEKPHTQEAKILFDADKVDSVGAIGIARSFMWIERNNASIYKKVDIDEYSKENLGGSINGRIKDASKHSIQIEYEIKSKHICEKLYTPQAKRLAEKRVVFIKLFLDELELEIVGKA